MEAGVAPALPFSFMLLDSQAEGKSLIESREFLGPKAFLYSVSHGAACGVFEAEVWLCHAST